MSKLGPGYIRELERITNRLADLREDLTKADAEYRSLHRIRQIEQSLDKLTVWIKQKLDASQQEPS